MDIRRYFVSPPARNRPSASKKECAPSTATATSTSKASSAKTAAGSHQGRHKLANEVIEIKSKKRLLTLSRKRTAVIDSDDEEDPIPPKKVSTRQAKVQRRMLIEDSEEEEVFPIRKQSKNSLGPPTVKPSKPSSPPKADVKKLTVDQFFGAAPVMQKKRPNKLADKMLARADKNGNDQHANGYEIHDDDDFIETLKALDAQNAEHDSENVKSPTKDPLKTPVKSATKDLPKKSPMKSTTIEPPKKTPVKSATKDLSKKSPVKSTIIEPPKKTPVKSAKPLIEIHREVSSTQAKQVSKVATADDTSSAEKRRTNYLAYMQFKNREGPLALGTKEIPEGAENCMQGLNFIVTGVLDSIERENAVELIKKYGGKVQASVCKSTDYMVVGRDAGPSKLEKAEKMGTKQISEDDFLDLIRTLPSKPHSASRSIGKKQASVSAEKKPMPAATPKTKHMIPKSLDIEATLGPSTQKSSVLAPSGSSSSSQSTSAYEISPGTSTQKSSLEASPPDGVKLIANYDLMWVDKYKPKTCKQIIGQNGDKSNVKKLIHWLSNWSRNHSGTIKKKASQAGKWNSDDGSNFKAALLSGPPGVGKTTSAQLVCKELGFTYVELNASDSRSKRSMQEVVAELLRNKSLTHYVMGNPKDASKHCLLMDEVDGMAGNEDRGGIQELIQLIKNSKIPVICMCNDRNHQKIRSLANYCFDLRFHKPRVEQLKGGLMSICFKEGLEISSDALQEIIIGANQDVRQILHHLSMWSVKSKKLSLEDTKADASKAKKDLKIGPFDVLRSVFSESQHKYMSIHDKSDLFFHDYSLSPLFVFENYLSVVPHASQQNVVKRLQLTSLAADSMCKGDLVEKLIRSEGHWGLLPVEAMFASVIPGDVLAGHIDKMINFPSWLGRNSTRAKTDRLLQELHLHTRLRTSCNKTDLNADYLHNIREAVVRPLVANGQEGVADAVAVMNYYNLLREDLDSIIDVTLWPNQPNPYDKLSSQVKAGFTRTYNKMAHTNPYATIGGTSKSRKVSNDDGLVGDDFDGDTVVEEEADEEVDDDVTKDAMIRSQSSKRKNKTKEANQTSKKGPVRKKGK